MAINRTFLFNELRQIIIGDSLGKVRQLLHHAQELGLVVHVTEELPGKLSIIVRLRNEQDVERMLDETVRHFEYAPFQVQQKVPKRQI